MLLKARREGAGTVYENAGQVCARSCGSLIEGLEIDCCGETRCGAHDARPLVSSYEKLPAAKRGTVCDAGSRCGLANALDQDATPVSYTHLDVYKRQRVTSAMTTIAVRAQKMT